MISNSAVQALTITGTGAGLLNQTLNLTLKPIFNGTFATAQALVNTGSTLIGELADASILGETNVTIPTTIIDPIPQELIDRE